jgi:predicted GIY-YIG superfamily endonuclease
MCAFMYYVYILASSKHGTLYIGVTRDLVRRVYEHRNDLVPGFTARYRVHRLSGSNATTIQRTRLREKKN